MKKILALCPEVREQECHHEHVYYSGSMPCTGLLTCSMCGTKFDSQEAVNQARKEVQP